MQVKRTAMASYDSQLPCLLEPQVILFLCLARRIPILVRVHVKIHCTTELLKLSFHSGNLVTEDAFWRYQVLRTLRRRYRPYLPCISSV